MKKAIIIIVVIAVILGALFLATKSCKKASDTETANTAEVEIRNIAKTVVATGKIEALYKAEIK